MSPPVIPFLGNTTDVLVGDPRCSMCTSSGASTSLHFSCRKNTSARPRWPLQYYISTLSTTQAYTIPFASNRACDAPAQCYLCLMVLDILRPDVPCWEPLVAAGSGKGPFGPAQPKSQGHSALRFGPELATLIWFLHFRHPSHSLADLSRCRPCSLENWGFCDIRGRPVPSLLSTS